MRSAARTRFWPGKGACICLKCFVIPWEQKSDRKDTFSGIAGYARTVFRPRVAISCYFGKKGGLPVSFITGQLYRVSDIYWSVKRVPFLQERQWYGLVFHMNLRACSRITTHKNIWANSPSKWKLYSQSTAATNFIPHEYVHEIAIAKNEPRENISQNPTIYCTYSIASVWVLSHTWPETKM